MKQKPLKILFVARDQFPPFRVDVAVLFGKEMAGRGHEIDWVLQSQADCNKGRQTRWQGGDVWVGPTDNGTSFLHRLHKHLLGFLHNLACTRLLFRKPYDIIQVKDRFFTAVLYLAAARICNRKYFYWLSYPFAEASLYEIRIKAARYPIVYLIRGMLYRFLLYKIIMVYADHVFVQSEQMKKDIQACGIAGEKMTAVPMGFEADRFQAEPVERDAAEVDGEPRIIYLGTLMKLRRIDFLIRAFSRVLKDIPNAKLYLIGAGETDEDIRILKREARRLGIIDAVIFTGFLERQKAMEIVRNADVCLSPFYPTPILNSTSPTKLIEYMALGKSVVANDHPEQERVITESGGGLCVPYEEVEFANAIVYLLKHPEINAIMGQKGRRWVFQNRTYAIIADSVERTYYEQLK